MQSDKGIKFVNATVQQYLKRQGVSFHTTHNPDIKGAVIERFNKSLKSRMYKYFTNAPCRFSYRHFPSCGDVFPVSVTTWFTSELEIISGGVFI